MQLTGKIYGSVRAPHAGTTPSNSDIDTRLTFLTLNAISNRPNPQTFVDLTFTRSDESTLMSAPNVNFFCWGEFNLRGDLGITSDSAGTKLLVESTHAVQKMARMSM